MALREGFTTGTAAAAAAVAAWQFHLSERPIESVAVPLPPSFEKALSVPIHSVGCLSSGCYYGEVRKDGGDDPDSTHGMIIRADIMPMESGGLIIDGGKGIGRVTLPGIGLPVGSAAINPYPRQQIRKALEALNAPHNLKVVISAPEGEKRARLTLNSALGIEGGISILGTHGIVKPYSNEAYLATIQQQLGIARAMGKECIYLCTGRRSAALLERKYPAADHLTFIIAGDFVKNSLELAKDFQEIHWGCFFGKLLKMACGHANTHARISSQDLGLLADIAGDTSITELPTAQAALIQLSEKPWVIQQILVLAKMWATRYAGKPVSVHLFHLDGREIESA